MAHRVAPAAEIELDKIWHFVATHSDSVAIADRVIESITDRFILLARYPEIGRSRHHDLRRDLRSFAVGEYIIFYRIEGKKDVLIVHVIRGSRDIESLLE